MFPLISKWIPAYGHDQAAGTQIQYSAVGSGGGIAAITNRTVDFGASDAPLTPDQFTACKGCVQIPWALSATAVVYNVPGRQEPEPDGRDREDLPRHDHELERPSIKALNPGADARPQDHARLPLGQLGHDVQLHRLPLDGEPHLEVARRQQSVNWPAGIGAHGNAGVAAVVSRTEGGVGRAHRSHDHVLSSRRPISGVRGFVWGTSSSRGSPLPRRSRRQRFSG